MKHPYTHLQVALKKDERGRIDEPSDIVFVDGREQPRVADTHLAKPILHHGANEDQDSLLSGELRCVMTTLSPTLVANRQIEFKDLAPSIIGPLRQFGQKLKSELAALGELTPGGDNGFVNDKKMLLPLQLGEGDKAPVIIPGSSIKGMIQHNVGSLVDAAIDRVDDATHSFRPNAKFPPAKERLASVPIALRIIRFDVETLELVGQPIAGIGDIQWVVGSKIQGFGPGDEIPAGSNLRRKKSARRGPLTRWYDDHSRSDDTGNSALMLLKVCFGADRGRRLAVAHAKNEGRPPAKDHSQVLVPKRSFAQCGLPASEQVVRNFLDSARHVASTDLTSGHVSERHPLSGDVGGLQPHRLPERNDVVFAELQLPEKMTLADANKYIVRNKCANCRIISLGQNYYYRWAHLETVKKRLVGWHGDNWVRETRAEFDPWRGDPSGGLLDPVRRLFGFVREAPGDDADGSASTRLSGRIAVNSAMERVSVDATLEERFLGASADAPPFTFILHPLAQPKGPSWASGYVPGNQTVKKGNPLSTLGDGIVTLRDRQDKQRIRVQNLNNGEFGRKHYFHHQEAIGNDGKGRAHYDLQAFIAQKENSRGGAGSEKDKAARRKPLLSNQSALVRRVSKPGREFGFTVRFKDLEPGELAVLAIALNPSLVQELLDGDAHRNFRRTKEVLNRYKNAQAFLNARFGLKIGHGKPLGMGSIAIRIANSLRWVGESDTEDLDLKEIVAQALNEGKLINDATLARLMDVLALRKDTDSYLSQELTTRKPVLDSAREIREAHSIASRGAGVSVNPD